MRLYGFTVYGIVTTRLSGAAEQLLLLLMKRHTDDLPTRGVLDGGSRGQSLPFCLEMFLLLF